MAEVKFGPLYSRIHELVGVKEFADTTVQMGFDSIWIPDTMITREHALDWAPTLGAFVEHTQDIMLGTCVVVVPHRHPAILAKEVATLDYLSGGRIIFGVGAGPTGTRAFEAAGVDSRQRGSPHRRGPADNDWACGRTSRLATRGGSTSSRTCTWNPSPCRDRDLLSG